MRIALKQDGNPALYPDSVDVGAPPPPGTVIDIDGREFTVRQLRLAVRVFPCDGGGQDWTAHYVAHLAETPDQP